MPCPENDFWSPFDNTAQFCARVQATNADFLATVTISDANGVVAEWGTSALLGGPVCVPLQQHSYVVRAKVRIGMEAPTVVLDLELTGTNFSSQCQFSTANTTFEVTRVLIP